MKPYFIFASDFGKPFGYNRPVNLSLVTHMEEQEDENPNSSIEVGAITFYFVGGGSTKWVYKKDILMGAWIDLMKYIEDLNPDR